MIATLFDHADHSLGSNLAHFAEWLSYRSQAGRVEGGPLNIVEAHHGNILRNTQTFFLHGADCSDCGNVVVREQGGEGLFACQQLFGVGISELRRRIVYFEVDDQIRVHGKFKFLRHSANCPPSIFRV